MEHIDSMILHNLVKIRCSRFVDEDETSPVRRLDDLNRDDVIEAVVRLLWIIDDRYKQEFGSYVLPSHIAKRFAFATALADAVNACGLREPVGYHSFLYINVFEIRQILLTLFDHLPTEKVWIADDASSMDRILANTSSSIKTSASRPWVPEFCRYLRHLAIDPHSSWRSSTLPERIAFVRTPASDPRNFICHLIDESSTFENKNFDSATALRLFNTIQTTAIRSLPSLPKKPKFLTEKLKATVEPEKTAVVQEVKAEVDEAAMRKHVLEQIARLKAESSVLQRDILEFRYAQDRLEDAIYSSTASANRIDPDVLAACEQASTEGSDSVLERLKHEKDRVHASSENAHEKFEAASGDLVTAIKKIRAEHNLDFSFPEKKSALNYVKHLTTERDTACDALTRQIRQLENHLAKTNRTLSRESYQQQTRELTASVNVQLTERSKILGDIQKLDREIKYLLEVLQRTYQVVTSFFIAQPSVNDGGRLTEAYRNLVVVHERCKSIVRIAQECGESLKSINDLTHAVDVEAEVVANLKIEEIVNDTVQIRRENEALQAELLQQ